MEKAERYLAAKRRERLVVEEFMELTSDLGIEVPPSIQSMTAHPGRAGAGAMRPA
jgi:hypothetical protein